MRLELDFLRTGFDQAGERKTGGESQGKRGGDLALKTLSAGFLFICAVLPQDRACLYHGPTFPCPHFTRLGPIPSFTLDSDFSWKGLGWNCLLRWRGKE